MDQKVEELPVIASYMVRITFRGPEGTEVPTNAEIEDSIVGNLDIAGPGVTSVTASSERLDK